MVPESPVWPVLSAQLRHAGAVLPCRGRAAGQRGLDWAHTDARRDDLERRLAFHPEWRWLLRRLESRRSGLVSERLSGRRNTGDQPAHVRAARGESAGETHGRLSRRFELGAVQLERADRAESA